MFLTFCALLGSDCKGAEKHKHILSHINTQLYVLEQIRTDFREQLYIKLLINHVLNYLIKLNEQCNFFYVCF